MNKLGEMAKVLDAGIPQSFATGTHYNGSADASGLGIDTKGFDDALIILHSGTNQAGGTLDVTVVAQATDTTASLASAISGAVFTQITTANDNAVYVGSLKVKDVARYI